MILLARISLLHRLRMVNAKIGREDNNNDFGRRTYNTAPPQPSSQSQQSSRDDHRRTYNTAPPRIVMSPPAQQPERNETTDVDSNSNMIS